MHDVLLVIGHKKLLMPFHLITKRNLKKTKCKNKLWQYNRNSYSLFYWLGIAANIWAKTIKISQMAIIASQQKTFKKGGIVKPNIEENKGELINLPDGSTIIPPDIARQIANSNNKINIENISLQIDKNKVDDIIKNIKEI
jgi:hypothetical protein